jgi:phospholipase/carboxylesterase
MAGELDGPRLEARGGQAKRLVVFLHGYGADGNDLIEIGRAWQPLLPDTAFVSPHAPEPCGQAPTGRQWFNLTFRTPNERWDGSRKAAPILERFLDAELARLKLPPQALALVGFSQGTMMALHVGLRRAVPPVAIVGYSGLFVLPDDAEPAAVAGAAGTWRSGSADPAAGAVAERPGPGGLGSAGGMAHVAWRRPRHRPGGPAPRR